MNSELLKQVIEAALMAVNEPLSVTRLLTLFENEHEPPDREAIKTALAELQELYTDRGIELKEVASGFRFQVKPDCAEWVNRLFDEKPQRYSRALMETLAIIAYRQPLTRGEIEDIRGVSVSSNIVKTLQEREWVRIVGHRDVPGKPELLATTKQFLDYFNLKRLSDLPSLAEIKDFDQLNPDLFEAIEEENKEAADGEEENQQQAEAAGVDEVSEAESEETEVSELDADEDSEVSAELDDEVEDELEGSLDDEDEQYDDEEDEDEDEEEELENDNVIPFSG